MAKPRSVQGFKMKWYKNKYHEYLKTPEVQQLVQQATDSVTFTAELLSGYAGYEGDVQVGRNRTVGMVKTTGKESREDNQRNNTLLKALGMSKK